MTTVNTHSRTTGNVSGVFPLPARSLSGLEIFIAPDLIKSKEAIAAKFDVDPDTVVKWAKDGAPIFIAGKKYQVDYHNMVAWLRKNKPAW